MIETVVFDLDDTICAYRRPGRELLSLAFDRVGVDPLFAVEDYYAIYDDHVQESDTVADNRERCFAALAAEAGADPETGRKVARVYAEERDHRNVRFLPGAREALASLADDYRIGLVTNGAPGMQGEKLAALGLRGAFEAEVYAGHGPAPKPAPEPFHRALAALDSAPARAVHVGNSLEADVAGANAAGLHSAWVPDGPAEPNGHVPDYTLESLSDLTDPPWE